MENLNELCGWVRGLDPEGTLEPYLEAAAVDFQRLGKAPFTLPEMQDWCLEASLDAAAAAAVLELAATVLADAKTQFLYFHCSRLIFDFSRLYGRENLLKWPAFEDVFPGRGSLFLLLIGLSAVPRIRQAHRVIGVHAQITRDTCGDIASRIEISRKFNNGRIGISLTCLDWLGNHVRGELFQFGRLQLHPVILNEPVLAYRQRRSREVLLLAEPGSRFTAHGVFDGAGGKLDADAWLSEWRESNGCLSANRFNARGRAEKAPVTINLNEWERVVDRSSATLNIHIPRGPRLSIADWCDSIRQAFKFFRDVRPVAANPVACTCKSWMFDPVLQDLLPENTALVSLQKMMHVFPLCNKDDRCGFYFIFGDRDIDLNQVSCETSLQRAIKDYANSGGALSGGCMLLFEDEIEGWQ